MADDKREVWTETTTDEGTFWHSAGIEYRLPGWEDEPTEGGSLHITGTGFGQGPIVYHFDRFIGTDREVITTSREPEIGEYAATPDGTPRIYYDDETGRFWFGHRDPNNVSASGQNMASLLIDLGGLVSTFRVGVRTWVPTAYKFPGASTAGTFPSASTWKCTWFSTINEGGTDLGGTDIPNRNVCFPTHIGSGNVNISGNSNTPRWYRDFPAGWQEFYTEMSHTSPTLHTFYQRGPGTHQVSDQPMEMIYVNDEGAGREVRNGDPFWSSSDDGSFNGRGYEALKVGGWFGQGPDYSDQLPLLSDVYLAFGTEENPERARACIILSNAATLTGSTEAYLLPPTSWADTDIYCDPTEYEDFGEDLHVHLILADGTLLQDVDYTREIE